MVRSNGWIRDGVGELLEAASGCARGSVGPGVEPPLICTSTRGRCWRWSEPHGLLTSTVVLRLFSLG
jgi:hypothetical protein